MPIPSLWHRLRAVFRREALDADMREEFRAHLEEETAHLMATRGLTRQQASRAAHIAFGGADRFAEQSRDVRRLRPLEDFARDMRHSLRMLARSRVFSAVAVLTLALGIGALSAIFTVLNSVVLQPLPYPDADRLVALHHLDGDLETQGISSVDYYRYRASGGAIEELAVYRESALNLAGDEGAQRIQIAAASPELFRLLGVQPVLGRLYDERDWTGSSMDLNWTMPILLGYDFWQSRFGGDRAVLGRILSINDRPREVVGVLPPGFAFPRRETQVWRMDVPPEITGSAVVVSGGYRAVGRLRAGVSVPEAQSEYAGIRAAVEAAGHVGSAEVPVVRPLRDAVLGETAGVLWIIFGSILILLLVACANVANLFAVRAEMRGREVAIRTALGAGRLRLARLFFAESLLVSFAGAALGLALAYWAVQSVVAFAPEQFPRLDEVRLDTRTVLFTASLAIAVTLLLGTLSLVRHLRAAALAPALGTGRGSTGADPRRRRVVDVMIGAQVALTLALLAGSALMLRSYQQIMSVERGFTAEGVLTVEVGLPFRLAMRHHELYDDVAERMRAIPGVTGVGGVSSLPLAGGGAEHPIRAAERGSHGMDAVQPVAFRFMLPGYFETMDTRVIDGIGFAPGETTEHEYPVVVSDALARRLFPNERAIGKRLERLDARGEPVVMFDAATRARVPTPPYTIAGVVANVRADALQAAAGEAIYIPVMTPRVEQSIVPTEMGFVLRSELPPAAIAAAARRAVHDVDPTLSVARIRSIDEIVAAATARERFLAMLLLVAGATSLLLGAVGIYGIAAFTVRRRTSEIAVRVALGARPAAVTWLVLRQALMIVLAGAAAGLTLALATTRVLHALLYEISPTDPVVLAGVTALMIAVAAAASLGPALRAARTDPATALRAE